MCGVITHASESDIYCQARQVFLKRVILRALELGYLAVKVLDIYLALKEYVFYNMACFIVYVINVVYLEEKGKKFSIVKCKFWPT